MGIVKNRWFDKFAPKEGIDGALVAAVVRAEAGLVDADLGGGVVKQRVARAGPERASRAGSARSSFFFRRGELAVFVFGFAKKDKANLSAHELATFRKAARVVLDLDGKATTGEIVAGRLIEVQSGDQNLSE